jgi:hypothetical protein
MNQNRRKFLGTTVATGMAVAAGLALTGTGRAPEKH